MSDPCVRTVAEIFVDLEESMKLFRDGLDIWRNTVAKLILTEKAKERNEPKISELNAEQNLIQTSLRELVGAQQNMVKALKATTTSEGSHTKLVLTLL